MSAAGAARRRAWAMIDCPETYIERVKDYALAPLMEAGDFACMDPDEPTADARMVAG